MKKTVKKLSEEVTSAESHEGEGKDYLSVVYDEGRAPKTQYPQQLAAHIMNEAGIKPGQKFLELGCGRGDFLKEFQKLGLDCYGVDRDADSQKFSPNIPIALCDLAEDKLPYPDGFFDVVYHKSVLEHVLSPDKLIKETKRVLKKGGKALILTPDWQSCMSVFFEDFTHVHPYDAVAVRDLLKIYGFKDVKVELLQQLPMTWRFPATKLATFMMRRLMDVRAARWLTEVTGVKFFRWSVELMVMGCGTK